MQNLFMPLSAKAVAGKQNLMLLLVNESELVFPYRPFKHQEIQLYNGLRGLIADVKSFDFSLGTFTQYFVTCRAQDSIEALIDAVDFSVKNHIPIEGGAAVVAEGSSSPVFAGT